MQCPCSLLPYFILLFYHDSGVCCFHLVSPLLFPRARRYILCGIHAPCTGFPFPTVHAKWSPVFRSVNNSNLCRRFRWSGWRRVLGGGSCSSVSLVLTSLTGVQVPLSYLPSHGWYESTLVHLPPGYHSAFLMLSSTVSY